MAHNKTTIVSTSFNSSNSSFCNSHVSSISNPIIQTHFVSHLHSFDPNPDIYNLTTSTEPGLTTNNNPSNHHHHHHQSRLLSSPNPTRDGLIMGKTPTFPSQEEVLILGMRNSKYLGPVQELLNEFCNLGTKQTCDDCPLWKNRLKKKKKNKDQSFDMLDGDQENHDNHDLETNLSSSSQSLHGLSLLELQKRKIKLLGLLEELDRRYKHYCEQMKEVVSSLEAVVGVGMGNAYSALASKAMSRHFRCLRDAIVGQIKATKKAIMGEKDRVHAGAGSTTRGETPRLRMLDQALRQQRSLHQFTMLETHPWRPQRGLPDRSVSVLRAWLFEHFLNPYPSDVDKHILARQAALTRSQVSNWFINARVRLWKPMVEQMYLEETKDDQDTDNIGSSSDNIGDHKPNESGLTQPPHDKKSTQDQVIRIEPDQFGRVIEGFDSVESLDFLSSNYQAAYGTQNDNNALQCLSGCGGGGGNNVSLTLGLQQTYQPVHYSILDDCQPVQYSILDPDQAQNLPYRKFMGAQLLHDFALLK